MSLPQNIKNVNTIQELQDATAKIAFAAYLHDLGKLYERSKPIDDGLVTKEQIDKEKSLFCPLSKNGFNSYSHIHAAYTSWAWSKLEKQFPQGANTYPFVEGDKNKTLIQSAAMHHKVSDNSDEFLHWVVAVADRISSGFERSTFDEYNQISEEQEASEKPFHKNNNEFNQPYQSTASTPNYIRDRLLSVFSRMSIEGQGTKEKKERSEYVPYSKNDYRLQLKPLTLNKNYFKNYFFPKPAENIIPMDQKTAVNEYRELTDYFEKGLEKITTKHQTWDHFTAAFDSLWQEVSHAIPSATSVAKAVPEVSLYDHSRSAAALAGSIWRFYVEEGKESELRKEFYIDDGKKRPKEQFLLIQGDFSGIQNFLFRQGGAVQSNAAKILRGRSFYISLLTELAAVKILDQLALPKTAQIINTAGKFLIVAPNTQWCNDQLKEAQKEINEWFFQETFGLAQFNIATTTASFNDFTSKNFGALQKKLFEDLAQKKYQSEIMDIPFLHTDYSKGVCEIDGFFPAQTVKDNIAICNMVHDQWLLGEQLVRFNNPLLVIKKMIKKNQNGNNQNTYTTFLQHSQKK